MPRDRPWWPIWVIVLGLVAVNVTTNRLVGPTWYVPVAIVTSVALVAFARRVVGCDWADLGMAREDVGRGLRWGGVILATVVVVLVIGMVLPATRPLFEDDRVKDMAGWSVLYAAFVRVTFGTVLLEEVAFRSVAPAVFATRMSRWRAIGAAAVLFGVWHVLPSLSMHDVNPIADDTVGRFPVWVTVLGAVLSTGLVALWFSFLREKSRSILAPMLAHWSSNAIGYLFAYAVINWM